MSDHIPVPFIFKEKHMEEEVNQRVATMIVSTSKMSAGVLARAMQRFLANEH